MSSEKNQQILLFGLCRGLVYLDQQGESQIAIMESRLNRAVKWNRLFFFFWGGGGGGGLK